MTLCSVYVIKRTNSSSFITPESNAHRRDLLFSRNEGIFVASIRQEQPSTFTLLTKLTNFEVGGKVSRQSDIETRARVL